MYPFGHLSNYAPDYKYAQSMPASIAPPGSRRGGLPGKAVSRAKGFRASQ